MSHNGDAMMLNGWCLRLGRVFDKCFSDNRFILLSIKWFLNFVS